MAAGPKQDQMRVKALLTEAITVLCKNGLSYRGHFRVEGLLGITLDDNDVFLVNIQETISDKSGGSVPLVSSTERPLSPGARRRSGPQAVKRRAPTPGTQGFTIDSVEGNYDGIPPLKRKLKEEVDSDGSACVAALSHFGIQLLVMWLDQLPLNSMLLAMQ